MTTFGWLNPAGSHVAAFATGYALHWLKMRHDNRKEKSAAIYTPLHEKLHQALVIMAGYSPLGSHAITLWESLVSSGRADKIPRKLRTDLAKLFKETYPAYDKTYEAARTEFDTKLKFWDEKSGRRAPGPVTILPFDWWQFVTQDSYQPGFDVDIDEAIFLKDWVMGATEFARWGGTQQFLQERRGEIRQLPEFVAFLSKLREVANETTTLQNRVKAHIV